MLHDATRKRDDLARMMAELGKAARSAAAILATAPGNAKDQALNAMADEIERSVTLILSANAEDVARAEAAGVGAAFIDRLVLDGARVGQIAQGIRDIAALEDPVGKTIAAWDRPNGLQIERVRTPIGVLGVIYESRPNVTADAGALCLKAGNAVILRGGSDSQASSAAIHRCMVAGLAAAGLPVEAIQLVPVTDRAAVGEMLSGLGGCIDVIVPRGGRSLVERVQREARVPVFAHLEGICHIYVDRAADLDMAVSVTMNAKMRRPGICGAAETLLVDRVAAGTHLKPLLQALVGAGCEIRGDDDVVAAFPGAIAAKPADWSTEYLDAVISVALVDGIEGAIRHIREYSSGHTESVLTEDPEVADRFLRGLDSAIVMHNASTQFADGGEFGMGAEIGIATGKMHARGPVGVEQLTSFKYIVRGKGQTRP